jgi:acyl-CoA reductase-like NAD-dependent aldehyde dehydrogenase
MDDDLIGEITARAWNSFTDWHGLPPEEMCRPLEAIADLLIRNN